MYFVLNNVILPWQNITACMLETALNATVELIFFYNHSMLTINQVYNKNPSNKYPETHYMIAELSCKDWHLFNYHVFNAAINKHHVCSLFTCLELFRFTHRRKVYWPLILQNCSKEILFESKQMNGLGFWLNKTAIQQGTEDLIYCL